MSDNNLRVYAAMRDEIEELKLTIARERRYYNGQLNETKAWAFVFMIGAFFFGLFI